jgi:hypothetical protein
MRVQGFGCLFLVFLSLSLAAADGPRPIEDVIAAMITVIPYSETELKDSLQEILKFREKYAALLHEYDPPEGWNGLKDQCWDKTTKLLNKRFPPGKRLKKAWVNTVIEIYTNKRNYKDYLQEPGSTKTNNENKKKYCCCG